MSVTIDHGYIPFFRSHNHVILSSFMTYHRTFHMNNKQNGNHLWNRNCFHFRNTPVHHRFFWVCVAQSLILLFVMFCRPWLPFIFFFAFAIVYSVLRFMAVKLSSPNSTQIHERLVLYCTTRYVHAI